MVRVSSSSIGLLTGRNMREYRILVEAPVIGRFIARKFSLDSWEKDEKRIEREIKKVRSALIHKHPNVKVWVEK